MVPSMGAFAASGSTQRSVSTIHMSSIGIESVVIGSVVSVPSVVSVAPVVPGASVEADVVSDDELSSLHAAAKRALAAMNAPITRVRRFIEAPPRWWFRLH